MDPTDILGVTTKISNARSGSRARKRETLSARQEKKQDARLVLSEKTKKKKKGRKRVGVSMWGKKGGGGVKGDKKRKNRQKDGVSTTEASLIPKSLASKTARKYHEAPSTKGEKKKRTSLSKPAAEK